MKLISRLLILVAFGWLGYTWVTIPEALQQHQLRTIAVTEHAYGALPAGRLSRVQWLVLHRARRLISWSPVLSACFLAAAVEGFLYRYHHPFGGYYRTPWLLGRTVLFMVCSAALLFLAVPWVVPTASTAILACGLVVSGFTLVAGFPALR